MTQMVDQELDFQAVLLLKFPQQHAGVADQHVDGRVHGPDRFGTGNDGVEVAEFEHGRRGPALHAGAGVASLFPSAAGADHVGAAQRQHAQGLVTDARIAAGHQGRPARQVEPGSNFLGRGRRPEGAHRHVGTPGAGQVGRQHGRGTGLQKASSIHRIISRFSSLRHSSEFPIRPTAATPTRASPPGRR